MDLPPRTICLYFLLAIASSAIWFAGFTNHIHHPESQNRHRSLILQSSLTAIYIFHLAIAIGFPICSRPWLWSLESKISAKFLEIFMIMMGWDDYDEEWWVIGGTRGTLGFAVGLILFLLPIERSGTGIGIILGLAFESFFLAEIVKHKKMEDSVFYTMMGGATAASRRVFGLKSWQLVVVVSVSLALIFFHSFLPLYDNDENVDGYSSATESELPEVVAVQP